MDTKEKLYKDGIVLTTDLYLSLGDRLRILFGRRVYVVTHTDTENVIGQNQTRSRVIVQRFFHWKRKETGYAEMTPKT